MELIDKKKVCKEIKRLIDNTTSERGDDVSDSYQKTGAYFVLNKLLHYIDTLEVKEVDLKKEIENYLFTYGYVLMVSDSETAVYSLAKHFYELGLNSKEDKE